jgi:hypothetical protein
MFHDLDLRRLKHTVSAPWTDPRRNSLEQHMQTTTVPIHADALSV